VHVGSHIRGVKVTDPRSRRARSQDLRTRAKHILKPTKKNILYWKKHRNQVDLIGVDVLLRRVRRIRAKYKHRKRLKILPRRRRTQVKQKRRYYTLSRKTGLTGVEEHQLLNIVAGAVGEDNIDKVDVNSLVDSSLSYRENKRIILAAVSPTMRDAAYLGYT
jgi:hypothetical protein